MRERAISSETPIETERAIDFETTSSGERATLPETTIMEEQALFLSELFEELDAITRVSRPEGQRSNALQEFEALYIATLAAYKANRDIPAELGATS